MQGARAGDSGIYKCKPNNAPEAQIKVHILIGGKSTHINISFVQKSNTFYAELKYNLATPYIQLSSVFIHLLI